MNFIDFIGFTIQHGRLFRRSCAPAVRFPSGHYRLSRTVAVGGYTALSGARGKAIVEWTGPDDGVLFDVACYTNRFENLKFVGGGTQLLLHNRNTNQTLVDVEGCEFQLARRIAVRAVPDEGADHLSTVLTIANCIAREYWEAELERLHELRDDSAKIRAGLDYATELLTTLQAKLPEIDQAPKELKALPKEDRDKILRTRKKIIQALCEKVIIYSDRRIVIEGMLDGSEAAQFELQGY